MKRVALVLLALLLASPVFAGQVQREIIDETLSTSNLNGEAETSIEGAERVTFFCTIDNNRTTACVTATVTAAVSIDGTNWQDISWFDVAGGATPVTSELTTGVEQTYVGWLDNRLMAKYIRIKVNATELALQPTRYVAADNAAITVTVVEDR